MVSPAQAGEPWLAETDGNWSEDSTMKHEDGCVGESIGDVKTSAVVSFAI